MSFDGMEFEDEGHAAYEDELGRPVGARPVGARPVGARPVGARPVGARPVGTRPVGARPVGARPVGARGGFLDPEEWSANVSELVCAHSAVIRLGATLVSTDGELRISAFDAAPNFRVPGAAPPPAPGVAGEEPLRPRDYTLEARVAVPDRLLRGFAANPELADTLKFDLAEALARRADQTFLGTGVGGPNGISALVRPTSARGNRLQRLRRVLTAIRGAGLALRNPGWIVHPDTLDALTKLKTVDGLDPSAGAGARTLDSFFALLRLDGADGGMLLGFPFVTSAAASVGNAQRIYFAADWQEAWVGVDPYFVTVDAPAEPAGPDETVIRASMSLDFTLRREAAFAWTNA